MFARSLLSACLLVMAGALHAAEAQVAVATDRVIDFKTFSVGPRGGSVTLKTDASWGGGAYVLVSVIQPRDPSATPKPRRANIRARGYGENFATDRKGAWTH